MDLANQPHTLPKWTQSKSEELANCLSHGIGLVAAVIGAPILLFAAIDRGSAGFLFGSIIFVATALALYLGSTLYHAWPPSRGKYFLQVVDHCAIFLLIAGTYTPLALGPLRHNGGPTILGFVWGLAIFGVTMKAAHGTSRYPKLAMSLYLGMGWSALIIIHPLTLAVPRFTLLLLFAGGVAYTTGVLFFANERLRYSHFVWHLFVLTGSSCHFFALLACLGNQTLALR